MRGATRSVHCLECMVHTRWSEDRADEKLEGHHAVHARAEIRSDPLNSVLFMVLFMVLLCAD